MSQPANRSLPIEDEPAGADATPPPGSAPASAQDQTAHWAAIYDIARLTSAKSFDSERAASSILEVALRLSGSESGALLVQERAGVDVAVESATNADADALLESPLVQELVEETMRTGRAAVRDSAQPLLALGGARSIVALPLRV